MAIKKEHGSQILFWKKSFLLSLLSGCEWWKSSVLTWRALATIVLWIYPPLHLIRRVLRSGYNSVTEMCDVGTNVTYVTLSAVDALNWNCVSRRKKLRWANPFFCSSFSRWDAGRAMWGGEERARCRLWTSASSLESISRSTGPI